MDHPRICGENYFMLPINSASPGSPPRMRGKQKHAPLTILKYRITPAYAGKTNNYAEISKLLNGSPPRMRGKPNDRLDGKLPNGITPAYAGKTDEA